MTALATVPAVVVRPVPWTRLAWVAWRRYRATLAATAGVLAVVGGWVVIDGLRMRSAFADYQTCAPARSATCGFAWQDIRDHYGQVGLFGVILLFLPGVIGAFAGAPVLARELETGTFRYTWTQGAGRLRWAIALLVPGALGVAAVMGGFGALLAWYDQPLVAAGIMPRLRPTVFPTTGTAAAGWALAGFALGVLGGLLWRRVLPALATAVAAWFGLAFVTANWLRPNYLAPLTTTGQDLPGSALSLDQWWTKAGVRVSTAEINSVLQGIGVQDSGTATVAHPGDGGGVDPVGYLIQHGYTQVTSYQPDGRFWTFQWIEFGWLTLLSIALLALSVWLLRRRSA